jgi:hypothetical protein
LFEGEWLDNPSHVFKLIHDDQGLVDEIIFNASTTSFSEKCDPHGAMYTHSNSSHNEWEGEIVCENCEFNITYTMPELTSGEIHHQGLVHMLTSGGLGVMSLLGYYFLSKSVSDHQYAAKLSLTTIFLLSLIECI